MTLQRLKQLLGKNVYVNMYLASGGGFSILGKLERLDDEYFRIDQLGAFVSFKPDSVTKITQEGSIYLKS